MKIIVWIIIFFLWVILVRLLFESCFHHWFIINHFLLAQMFLNLTLLIFLWRKLTISLPILALLSKSRWLSLNLLLHSVYLRICWLSFLWFNICWYRLILSWLYQLFWLNLLILIIEFFLLHFIIAMNNLLPKLVIYHSVRVHAWILLKFNNKFFCFFIKDSISF